MIKIGCITFHASHNYGSMLQAYALQEFMRKSFGYVDYTIINFRSQRQKGIYGFPPRTRDRTIKYKVFSLFNAESLQRKYDRFESFLTDYLLTTQEINDENLLCNMDFDIYIAGGDQIWNPVCGDFSWAYYLNFVAGGKKISYAPSMGPSILTLNEETKRYIRKYLSDFDAVSVREEGTKKILESLSISQTEIKELIDPTLLLNKSDWKKLASGCVKQIPSSYILFYTLYSSEETYLYVKKIGRLLHKKVVVTKPTNRWDFLGYYENHFDTGPIEFLKLIEGADLIVSTSFHGCVFSTVFGKPFIALDCAYDNRIRGFLKKCNLESKILNSKTAVRADIEKLADENDYSEFNKIVSKERKRSFEFLKENLVL